MKTAEATLATIPAPPAPAAAAAPRLVRHTILSDYLALIKPRLTAMVLLTVAVGFLLASPAAVETSLLLNTLLGTGLVAAGASALNQWAERRTDGLMRRTMDRPLPARRIRPSDALRFGVLTAAAGFLYLAILVHPVTAFLGVLTLVTYVFVYTPLKRRSSLNTFIGAISGALPPLMGWTAAAASLDVAASFLFLILLLWQLPHFWAIAWIHREDYARAGLKMVPVLDPTGGRMTGRLMVQHCLMLLLASLGPALTGLAGERYLVAAFALGLGFTGLALAFLVRPSRQAGRRVLFGSLAYLPLLLAFWYWDRI